MSRTFQDENFLVWEAFASGGGLDDDVRIMFHCITDRRIRPRSIATSDDTADATRAVQAAPSTELLGMLKRSQPIP